MFNDSDLNDYIKDLKELVEKESPSNNAKAIKKVIDFFVDKVLDFKLNANTIVKEYNKEAGPCLIITNAKDPLNEDLDLLMMAHMDTVYPIDTVKTGKNSNFIVDLDADTIKAPGVIDDKGPSLLGLYALKYIALPSFKFAFLLNSNEEVGTIGNDELIRQLSAKAKYCINLEAGRVSGAFVDQRLGLQNYKIILSNENKEPLIHSANQQTYNEANNTILEINNVLMSLRLLNSPYSNNFLNFKILSSDANKRYAELKDIVIGVQARFLDESFVPKVETALASLQTKIRNPKVLVSFEKTEFDRGLYLTKASKEFKILVEKVGRKQGLKVAWESSFGGADSTFVVNQNCATLDGFGPIGGDFHNAKEEYLKISSVKERANLLIGVINEIIASKKASF
jgi:glutamate carboxypeptidase